MEMTLKQVLNQQGVVDQSATQLAQKTKLPRTTIVGALERPIGNSSFKVIAKILKLNQISLDVVNDAYLADYDKGPSQVESDFLNQTDLSTLTIMGIQFSTKENFWNTRDSIINSIYEGHRPTKKDVEDAYQHLEQGMSADEVVANIIAEFKES